MFDWVPLEYYSAVHYFLMLLLVLLTLLISQSQSMNSDPNFRYMKIMGTMYFIYILIYMGLRPISGVFIDMLTYNGIFKHYANGGEIYSRKDIVFHIFTKLCSQIMTAHFYFLTCVALYVIPLYVVCKKWFNDYWFFGFLFLVSAFSFWAYGTNGIRNGIAGSLFLLGISREKRISQAIWILLAIGFHKTMLLPAGAFIIANFYNKPKWVLFFWVLCIPISLVAGGFFESLFGSLGFDDERMAYFTNEVREGRFASTGFRWDFLLYSSTAVFAGWFFIVKRNFNDKVYFWLFNTYVISNGFWILVIRANFSNRFAYLSWFMIGVVIIYPLLKQYIVSKQYKKIGLIMLAYVSFTLFMNILKLV